MAIQANRKEKGAFVMGFLDYFKKPQEKTAKGTYKCPKCGEKFTKYMKMIKHAKKCGRAK